MAEAIKDKGDLEVQNQVSSDVTPSAETKESPEGQETQKEAKFSLEQLKKEIESGNMSVELMSRYLESINELKDKDFKSIVLGMIFSGLNRKGIKFQEIKSGKIVFEQGNSPLFKGGNFASEKEVAQYQETFNEYIEKGVITLSDISATYVYRTSDIEKASQEKMSTTQYAVHLLKKYGITVENKKNAPLSDLEFKTREQYDTVIQVINKEVTNQADKEFLILFMNDRLNKNNVLNENQPGKYDSFDKKANKAMLDTLNTLDDKTKAVLGLGKFNNEKDILNKWTETPKAALMESINNDGITLGMVLGLIGALLFGKKGFFGGLLGGVLLAGGGGTILEKHFKKGFDSVVGNTQAGENGNSTEEKPLETNGLFEKFKGNLEANSGNLDKKELSKKWEELSKNDKFLSAPASLLKIFETEKDEAKLKEELKKYGIELTGENKEYYKCIFTELVKDRNEKIGEPTENENIKTYLERTSKKEVKVAVAGGVGNPPESKPSSTKNEVKTLGETEKKQLLEYFDIQSNVSESLVKNLDSLGLNLFSLLAGYKNFIETNLKNLDSGIKNKIKKSIGIKVGLINDKVNELKAKEIEQNKGSLGDFKNNRWIINNQIKDLFEKTNFLVLPSAYILAQDSKTSEGKDENYRNKIEKTKKMFDSELTSDGDFDKTFFSSGEIWDSSRNNWEVFDITNSTDIALVNGKENDLQSIDLLNEKDKEIESDAMLAYLITAGIQVIPYAGAVVSIPAMTIDTVSSKDGTLSLLKTFGIVPEEYRMEKHLRDNLLGGVGLIATVFGVQGAVRGVKLAEKSKVLKMIKFDKFEDILQKVSSKFGMSKEHTNFVSTQLKKILGVSDEVKGAEATADTVMGFTKSKIPENFGLNEEELNIINNSGNIYKKIIIEGEDVTLALIKEGDIIKPVRIIKSDKTILEGDEIGKFLNTDIVSGLSKVETKMFNQYAENAIKGIKSGETKTIGGIKIKNTGKSNFIGKFKFEYTLPDGKIKRGTKEEIFKMIDISKVGEELKQTGKFEGIIKQANLNKTKIISGNKVSFEEGEIVIFTKDNTKLIGTTLETFISKNFAEIMKSFGTDLTKVANPRVSQFKELSEKFAKLMEKTKFSGNEVPMYKKLLNELALPGRSIAQIIDTFANSTNKGTDLAKILLLGDRANSFTKMSNYSRLAINAGISSSLVIGDENLSASDAIELVLYNTMGLIVGGVSDFLIKD